MNIPWLICCLQICHTACGQLAMELVWEQESGANWEIRVNAKWELTLLGKGTWKYEIKGEILRVVYLEDRCEKRS